MAAVPAAGEVSENSPEHQPELLPLHGCAVIYWAPAGTQFSLRTGAYRLCAVAMDQA